MHPTRDFHPSPLGTVRRAALAGLTALVLASPTVAQEPADAEPADDGWTIEIIPLPAGSKQAEMARNYYEVYQSIPYLCSEYQANPAYRHEATMEILFGKLRPMTIVKHTGRQASPPRVATPYAWPYLVPRGYPYVDPYRFPGVFFDFGRGPYSRAQHLFGYEGGWPLKFYLNGTF